MPAYIVRETFTVLHFVEAENETAARAIVEARSPRDFDEIDQAAPPVMIVSIDPEA